MKKLFALSILLIVLSGCLVGSQALSNRWWPSVGDSAQELYDNWGASHDCSIHQHQNGPTVSCWYNMDPLFGWVTKGYCRERMASNILVTLQNSKIVSVYFP